MREQEIGEIDAGDQEDQADHAHQHAAGKRELLALIDAESRLVERKEFDGAAFVVAGIFLFESGSDGFHGGPGLRNVNLRFHAADNGEPAKAAVVFERFELPGQRIVAHGDGNPEQVRAAEGDDSFEARRRHAHDRVGRPIQGDGLADILFVGTEPAGPQAVAQNHFRVAAELLVAIGDERAPAIGLDAQHIEEIATDQRGVQLLWLGLASPIQRNGESDHSQTRENGVLIAIVFIVGERSTGELEVGVGIDG